MEFAICNAAMEKAKANRTVFAQRPKLSQYKKTIAQNVARLLGLAADRVSVKAKTGERVGPVGREEAIEASAIVLIERAH